MRRSSYEIKSLNEQINSARQSETESLKRIKKIVPDEAAQAKAEQLLEHHRTAYEKAEAKASKIRSENEELSKKIVDISKSILDGPKEALKTLQLEKKKANSEITAANVEIKTAARNLANSEKKLSNYKTEFEENNAAFERYGQRLEVIGEERLGVKDQLELALVECENLGREISDKSKTKKDLDAQTQRLETEKIDCQFKMEKLKEGLKSNEHEQKHYTHLQSNLKLHNIEALENGCFVDDSVAESDVAKPGEELKKYEEDDLGKLIFAFIDSKFLRYGIGGKPIS